MTKVSIRHNAGTYHLYRNQKNEWWNALAEFIDNAIQSFTQSKSVLAEVGSNTLTIEIFMGLGRESILIRDNAGGISDREVHRAFEPANRPDDDTGMSEFGIGMKQAALWFGDNYQVRSSAIGEATKKTFVFELDRVVREGLNELELLVEDASEKDHFTEVEITGLGENAPQKERDIQLVGDYLGDIYRYFLRKRDVKILLNDRLLDFKEPKVLNVPKWDDPEGDSILWKMDIDLRIGEYSVSGFVGLLETMNEKKSGFSLFRRGRVIEGAGARRYKPDIICGASSSHRGKRIFGELEMKGFAVSFDKGKFLGNNDFEAIWVVLKKELSKENFNLIQQANKYRVSHNAQKLGSLSNKSQKVTESVVPAVVEAAVQSKSGEKKNTLLSHVSPGGAQSQHRFEMKFRDVQYLVLCVESKNNSFSELYRFISNKPTHNPGQKQIEIEINRNHDFFSLHRGSLALSEVKLITAQAVALHIAPNYGVTNSSVISSSFNALIQSING